MADRSANPIPKDLADSFFAAVVRYSDGGFGSPDPTVGFRGLAEPISTICAMVEPFKNDQIPKDILARLFSAEHAAGWVTVAMLPKADIRLQRNIGR
jgi:hypothetical protein